MLRNIFCLICIFSLSSFFMFSAQNAEASNEMRIWLTQGQQAKGSLRLVPGAWQRAVQKAPQMGNLRPSMRKEASKDASDSLGVLKQAQVGLAFPGPGSPAFTLLMIDVGLMVGSIVVTIGTSIAQQTGGDLTGWKVAGLVIDGVALVTSIGMIAAIDMKSFPLAFAVIIYVSLGISALSLVWGAIKLAMYVNRREKKEAKELPENSPSPSKKPVVVVPWGTVDLKGNATGGLAFAGQF